MRKLAIFLLAICCPLLFTHAGFCDENFDRRKAIETEWLREINRVAVSINSDELNKISFFLNKNAVLGAPHQFGVRLLEGGKKRSLAIIFVPVFQEDCSLGREWESFFNSDVAVEFLPDIRVLSINTRIKFSWLAKAVALAREGYVAHEFIGINCKSECEIYYNFVNKDAQSFQHKIMELWGGKSYCKLVYEEANRIARVIKKNDAKGFFLPMPTAYDRRISRIFIKPLSSDEGSFWQTGVWTNSVFVAIENNPGGDVGEQKMLFLKALEDEPLR